MRCANCSNFNSGMTSNLSRGGFKSSPAASGKVGVGNHRSLGQLSVIHNFKRRECLLAMLQAFNEERLTPYLVKTPVPTGRNCQLKSPRALHSSIWIYLAAFNHPHFSDCLFQLLKKIVLKFLGLFAVPQHWKTPRSPGGFDFLVREHIVIALNFNLKHKRNYIYKWCNNNNSKCRRYHKFHLGCFLSHFRDSTKILGLHM